MTSFTWTSIPHASQGCHPFEVTRREAPTKDDIPQTANRTPQECCHTEKIVAIWMKLYSRIPASSGASIRTGIGNLPYMNFLFARPVACACCTWYRGYLWRFPTYVYNLSVCQRVKLFFDWFRFENELIVDPREHRRVNGITLTPLLDNPSTGPGWHPLHELRSLTHLKDVILLKSREERPRQRMTSRRLQTGHLRNAVIRRK